MKFQKFFGFQNRNFIFYRGKIIGKKIQIFIISKYKLTSKKIKHRISLCNNLIITSFAFVLRNSFVMMGSAEKSFARITADGAIMWMVGFFRRGFICTDWTNPYIIHFRNIFVDSLYFLSFKRVYFK